MNPTEQASQGTVYQTIAKVVNLMDPSGDIILNMANEEARERVESGDPDAVRGIDGQFAICAQEGRKVRMARSIGRPMRYFLAKQADGPCLIVAETMQQIQTKLEQLGLGDQFHPSYTRMVPAHYLVELELVGCPDPNPKYDRFFTPMRNRLPRDLDAIGEAYVGQLASECDRWLSGLDDREPIGVLFSGGIDSGAILIVLNHLILQRGQAPTRLKAFTLGTDDQSLDASQAHEFLSRCGLSHLWELMQVPSSKLDWRQAVRWIEDYKPLDVQSATMAIALCQAIRDAYPDWKFLVDGDGGDENLKDYPIEDNPELTIRSVLNNLMLYHEGWGVHAIKHSLVYTGGQSRGHIRTWAPGNRLGFVGFSPLALPSVIEISEGIPFIELTNWDHDRLYDLKGEVVRRGVQRVTGVEMPIYPKRRFQHGAVSETFFAGLFPKEEREYRDEFLSQFS
ncbi:MAG: asparagine synthase-related protein [Planctomycetota bacterium]|jgi:asparagine synthase (glutamine-hydrolysing)